jgi:hypothetical protein
MRPFRILGTPIASAAALAVFAACSAGSQLAQSPTVAAGDNGVLGNSRRSQATAAGISGWLSPQAAAAKSRLFVADQPNQRVDIFPQGGGPNPAPIGQITDAIGGPDGLFVDGQGTLYVCNFGFGNVTEYPKGQTTHSATLTGSIGPKYVVAGVDGTVYVSDFASGSNGRVLEYAGGSTTPTTTIPFQTFPAGLALDKHNKLYVAFGDANNNDVEVLKFAPGSTKGKNLGIHLKFANAGGATFDKSGNYLLDDQSLPGVDVFPPGATQPSQQIKGFSLAYQIALNHRDTHLYVSDPVGSVSEVAYPSGTPIKTISNSLSGAYGVATSPDSSH